MSDEQVNEDILMKDYTDKSIKIFISVCVCVIPAVNAG